MASIQIKKSYVDLPEGQVHYRYTAPSGPKEPIIFLHKSASSSASYEPLQHHYSALGHPTYAPDLPGFGQSFDPTPPKDGELLTTPWYCSILFAFLSSLGLKTYHLVGHHSGACLSLELAALHPTTVLSLTLIGPTLMSASERLALKARFFAPFNEPVEDGSHLLATWTYLHKMGIPSSDLELWQREFLDHARAWKGRTLIYGAVWEQDGQALLREVKCRVLCMCAEDDVLWEYWHWVDTLRGEMQEKVDVRSAVVKGANFECDLDVEGCTAVMDGFLEG